MKRFNIFAENPMVLERFCRGKFADRIEVTEEGKVIVDNDTFNEIMNTKQYRKYICNVENVE